MKEHELPHWRDKAILREDADPYSAGGFDFKLGARHKREGKPYNPPRKWHESSYEQGYNFKE